MNKSLVIASTLLLAVSAGCTKDKNSTKAAPAAEKTSPAQPNPHGATANPHGTTAQPTAQAGLGSGKVVETMDSGGYTYVKVDVGGKEVWAAGPQTQVAVGDTVSLPSGTAMPGYHSKTLDRTFDMIYFVNAIGKGGAGAAMPANPHAGGKLPVAKVDVKGIAKAEGGKTVAEIYADKAALAGKPVLVRGQVVKYNGGIMNRNWIHIQDGSGAAGTNDLTVTSQDKAAVGDTVLVKGTLVLNKDFGAGYKYDVVLEGATVTKE